VNPGSDLNDYDAQALAEALSSRVHTLAAAARDAVAAIDADQAGYRDRSEMADELIDSVTARIGEIAADCDDLNGILAGFRSLLEATPVAATPPPAPPVRAPSAPVTIAPGVTEYRGTGAVEPVAPRTEEDGPAPAGAGGAPEAIGRAGAPEAPEAPEAPMEPPRISEGVRLLATQMSVAGSSVTEIARRLHDEFGVENSDLLVRELFGEPEPG
jgi:hypothetical protein